ncbi:MAG: TRAP transporter large permease subunit [Deltaproteobacteria bacterium]|nr:TRAP transporter large permease subunit [Deltaproteobacteria bacterium]MBW1923767.1 TRAP transporter large permease subunit [Deltaproteobacteria bacterium]MBW1949024.1 TRAP transporter large permease subunit [Deltaproteobacteria bacterium]MBW2007170.1 TRAP transporter large permease subunit [Deltaproteobacteria bacterium]MBW2101403.1 TRAP transporter large permease subunit [Deltaproteobacteria bacterium]
MSWVGAFAAGITLVTILFVVLYEIMMRRFFNAPTTWSIELVTFLMVWFSLLTLAMCQRLGRHVRVDLLISRFGARTALLWNFVTLTLTLVFTIILLYFSWLDFWESFQSGETSASIWAPVIWPMKLAMPIGAFLLCFQMISDLLSNARRVFSVTRPDGMQTGKEDVGLWDKAFLQALFWFVVLMAVSSWLLVTHPALGVVVFLLVILFAGVPIFAALGLLGMMGLYLHFGGHLAVTQVPEIFYAGIGNFTLAALPLFILTGFILEGSGSGEELYELFSKWIGGLPGGLGLATILSCAFFAAISISSVATVATIGLIALPALTKRKYRKSFSYGLVGSGSTLGIMIPPSGTMILYAAVTEESMGKLLIAGIIPGLLLVMMFVLYTFLYAWRTRAYEKEIAPSWNERWRALGNAVWVILVPLLIVAGLFTGVFTVLECGAVAAIYTIAMVLLRRKVRLRDMPRLMTECGLNAGFILIIIAGALTMGRFITLLRLPQMAMSAITDLSLSPGMVILAMMILLAVLGLFLEVASVMMITLPILYPIVMKMGFDGIWFAVLMTLNMEMALITPPVGLNLYVIQGITGSRLAPIIKGMLPFYLLMLLGMIILYTFPRLSLFLPGLLIG